jgi:hypothetical protein
MGVKQEMPGFLIGTISAGLTYGIFKYLVDKQGFRVGEMLFYMVIGGVIGIIVNLGVEIVSRPLR